jgi:predicted transcriptional regulator
MAQRANTAQSVIARIETGLTDPSSETLNRLLTAAGYELRCELLPRAVPDSHMLEDVARIMSLTPEDRLIEVRNASRFESAAKRV